MKLSRFIVILIAAAVTMLFFWQANQAAAATPAPPECHGRNLMDNLETHDPAGYRQILEAEKNTPNGNAIFWKIERPGVAPSYLYGTMHVSDARLTKLPVKAEQALGNSRVVALELSEVLNEQAMATETMRNIGHIAFQDGRSLDTLLKGKALGELKAALKDYGMPFNTSRFLKPWFVAVAFALPLCEVERKKTGLLALDQVIGETAQMRGIKVVGLETVEEQFAAFDSLSLEDQTNFLVSSLQMRPVLEDQIETMKQFYLAHKIGGLWELAKVLTREHATPATLHKAMAALARFKTLLLTKRNHVMAKRALPLLDKGGAFIAVGALHLPGKDGLVALLRRAGYTLTPQG